MKYPKGIFVIHFFRRPEILGDFHDVLSKEEKLSECERGHVWETKVWAKTLSIAPLGIQRSTENVSSTLYCLIVSCVMQPNRGLTEENTQLRIIFPIGYFKFPMGYILSKWGLGIYSLTLLYMTQKSSIPKWVYYPQIGILYTQLGIICPIGDTFC